MALDPHGLPTDDISVYEKHPDGIR